MSKGNILIVEDEYITALDLKTQLILKGHYDFEIVASGEEAVAKALAEKYDLIIMDIKLKGQMDGIEAAEKILEKKEVAIVYVSGNSDLLYSNRLKKTKHVGLLRKPVYEYQLNKILEKIFNKN